jgi:hypothetical protein
MSMGKPMEKRRLAVESRKRWLACPALLLVLGIGCSSSLSNGPRTKPKPATDAAEKRGVSEPTFPNPDLAAKHQAAKAAPKDFDVLFAYVSAVADFCLASLVDESCGSACKDGPKKYKPATELDPKNWVLAQNALAVLDPFKYGEGLAPAQFEQFVAVKGRLLGLAGQAEQEQTLIDGYATAHPDAVPIIRRRLEILRGAGNIKESEAQCVRSRVSMKSAADSARIDLLTTCVSLHPDNKEGRPDPPDYTRYLPSPLKAEQRLYHRYLIQRCIDGVGSKETRCAQACACGDQPDKQKKAECKQGCRDCRIQAAQRIRDCKKTTGR